MKISFFEKIDPYSRLHQKVGMTEMTPNWSLKLPIFLTYIFLYRILRKLWSNIFLQKKKISNLPTNFLENNSCISGGNIVPINHLCLLEPSINLWQSNMGSIFMPIFSESSIRLEMLPQSFRGILKGKMQVEKLGDFGLYLGVISAMPTFWCNLPYGSNFRLDSRLCINEPVIISCFLLHSCLTSQVA